MVILGNAGSGKTTLARSLSAGRNVAHLSLDDLAWEDADPPSRRANELAFADIDRFTAGNPQWIIEGCYGSLISHAARNAERMYFLNIGIEACVANCRSRPWEPDKYASKDAQDDNLEILIKWVRGYRDRCDDCSLEAHAKLFAGFRGWKAEITSNADSAAQARAANP